jgi:hypothetical protein
VATLPRLAGLVLWGRGSFASAPSLTPVQGLKKKVEIRDNRIEISDGMIHSNLIICLET